MAKILSTFKKGARAAFEHPARVLVRAGISPDAVTLFGTAGVVASAFVFATRGALVAATVSITAFCLVDVLDGAMARARGYSTRFGALLDSTCDRLADGAVFGCVAWFFFRNDQPILGAVVLSSVVGMQIISYVKARAEGLGFTCNVGIAERFERLILLGITALVAAAGVSWALPVGMWLLLVLVVITILQRVLHVRRQEPVPAPRGAAG